MLSEGCNLQPGMFTVHAAQALCYRKTHLRWCEGAPREKLTSLHQKSRILTKEGQKSQSVFLEVTLVLNIFKIFNNNIKPHLDCMYPLKLKREKV